MDGDDRVECVGRHVHLPATPSTSCSPSRARSSRARSARAGPPRRRPTVPGDRAMGLHHRCRARDLGGAQLPGGRRRPVARPACGWRSCARRTSRSRTPGTSAGSAAPAASTSVPRGSSVPAEWTCNPMAGEACLDLAIAHVPAPAFVALAVSRVALGIAAGALDDIAALAGDKVPLLSPGTLATSPTYHRTSPRRTPGCAVPARCTTRPSGPSGRPRCPAGRSPTRPGLGPGSTRCGRSSRPSRSSSSPTGPAAAARCTTARRCSAGSGRPCSDPALHRPSRRARRRRTGAGGPGAAGTGVLSRPYWGCIAALIAASVAASSSVGLNMKNSVPASTSGTWPGAM